MATEFTQTGRDEAIAELKIAIAELKEGVDYCDRAAMSSILEAIRHLSIEGWQE